MGSHDTSSPEGPEAREQKHSDSLPRPEEDSYELSPSPPGSASTYLEGVKLWAVTCAMSVSYFLILLNSTVVVTAIPSITSEFDSTRDVGWYGSAYLIANCALQPLSGKIYTFYSLKYCFILFLAVFELGSLICGVANSSTTFIVGRAVAGAGGSGIMNGSMTIVTAVASQKIRPYIIGLAMAFGAVGQVIGPLIGGAFTQYVTWRWSFYLNLPLGGATGLVVWLIYIPDQRHKEQASSIKERIMQLDPVGFFAFAPAVVMLLLALNWGGSTYAWGSSTIIGLFSGAFAAAVVFLFWEYRLGNDSMIPFWMLKDRIIASCCLTGFLQAGAIVEMTYFMPIWFQAVRSDTPTMSGVDILPTVASQVVFAALTGVFVGKIGYPLPFAEVGSVCMAVGAGLMTTLTPSSSTAKWVGYQILTGAGRGIVQQLPVGVMQTVLTGEEIAVGSSLLAFVQYLSAAVFLSAATALFEGKLISSLQILLPTLSPSKVLEAGATGLAGLISSEDAPKLLQAYNDGVVATFYIAAGAGAATVFTSLGMGGINVKRDKGRRA